MRRVALCNDRDKADLFDGARELLQDSRCHPNFQIPVLLASFQLTGRLLSRLT